MKNQITDPPPKPPTLVNLFGEPGSPKPPKAKPNDGHNAPLGLTAEEYTSLIDASHLMHDQDAAQNLLLVAREMILCNLPLKPLRDSGGKPIAHHVRTAKTSTGTLKLILTGADPDTLLPFGTDRAVLAWLQTKAKQQNSPIIAWSYAKEYFDMFSLTHSGTNYKRFKESWKRISNCSFSIIIETSIDRTTESLPVIKRGHIPTIKNKSIEAQIPNLLEGDIVEISKGLIETYTPNIQEKYFVQLSDDIFDLIKQAVVPLRLEIMRHFYNEPKGWDFAQFICYRSFLCEYARVAGRKSTAYISWKDLEEMMGSTDKNPLQLRATLRKILTKLKFIWPECQATLKRGGILEVKPPLNSVHPVKGSILGTLNIQPQEIIL